MGSEGNGHNRDRAVNDENREESAAPLAEQPEPASPAAPDAASDSGAYSAEMAETDEDGPPAKQPPIAEESGTEQAEQPAAKQDGEADAEPEAVAAERDKLKDQVLRIAADFDNFRKRSRRDLEESRLKGNEDAIREFLPVFDNLSRAIGAYDTAKNADSIVEGVRMVLKMFDDVSERIGLQRLPAIGQRFDPAVHDAIQQVETDQYPPGTVVTEVNPGYRFRQRLLRPSIVIVARAPTRKRPEAEEQKAAEPPPTAGAETAEPPASQAQSETSAPEPDPGEQPS